MPGEGDVTALPLFRRGAEEALASELVVVVRVGRGRMCGGELRILLSSLFGANNPFVLLFSRGRTLRIHFS